MTPILKTRSTSKPKLTSRAEAARPVKTQAAPSPQKNNVEGASSQADSQRSTPETLELAPIKISRAPNPQKGNAQVSRLWWLIDEQGQSCEQSDDINAPTHPAQLLAQGCYTKLSAHGKMRIKCDGAPMGPKTYLFAESRARCYEIIKPPVRTLPSDFQKVSDPEPEPEPPHNVSNLSPSARGRSRVKDTWHCVCYQEIFQGEAADSTACRKSRESCLDLEQKVAEGSPILVKGSVSVGCKRVKAKEPWDLFGVKYQWLHSSEPGSWWTPRGCFLAPKSKRVRRARSSPKRARSSAQAKRAQTPSPPPSVVTQPIEADSRCAEACWAHLARDGDRLQRFKQRAVPSRFRWASSFAQSVNLIVETCEARKKQQKSGSYRRECLQGGVKACTKLCERAQ